MIDILLELGAKVDSLDKFGDTPLIVAITSENPRGFSIISKLIKAGANPFYQPKNRKSANELIEEWGNNYPDYQKIKNFFLKQKQNNHDYYNNSFSFTQRIKKINNIKIL